MTNTILRKIPAIISGIALLYPIGISAQDSSVGYVKIRSMLNTSGTQYITEVKYYDAFGRESQILRNGYNSSAYMRNHVLYDANGRRALVSLPLYASMSPSYERNCDENGIMEASYDAFDDDYGFSRYTYDSRDRVTYELPPGNDWDDNAMGRRKIYSVNRSNSVLIYTASSAGLNQPYRYYAAGELKSEKTIDEDGHTQEVFTNRLGQKILERKAGEADTYYVYDDFGRLRFVLTPEYQNDSDISKFAYEYKYDVEGRVIEKTLPGCSPIRYWYDESDRLVCIQDGLLRNSGLYRFYLYDAHNNICVQGHATGSPQPSTSRVNVTFSSSSYGILGTGYQGVSMSGFINPVLELANYYGSYAWISSSAIVEGGAATRLSAYQPSSVSFTPGIDMTHIHGLLTGRKEMTSEGNVLYSSFYYDARGRSVAESTVMNVDNSWLQSRQTSELTFTGKPHITAMSFTYGNQSHTAVKEYSYDSTTDKPTSEVLRTGNSTIPLASFSYDSWGRTIRNTRQGNNTQVYTYDIHGWPNSVTGNNFSQSLHYADGAGTPCYNGNISSMTWTGDAQASSTVRGYIYEYDDYGRLQQASYGETSMLYQNPDRYTEGISSYDMNGNPLSLLRYGKNSVGQYSVVDNLQVEYNGNQLKSVTDDAIPVLYNGATDFNDQSDNLTEYTYDANGSMTSDLNRGITSMTYDLLGHVKSIIFSNGGMTSYEYSASGIKLAVSHYTDALSSTSAQMSELSGASAANANIQSALTHSYRYVGDYILENGSLSRMNVEGGYLSFTSGISTPSVNYYTYDYLGNIRTVASASGVVGQVNVYYPFGTIIPDLSSSPDYQPNKLTGKEYDHFNGLNTYDFGARQYFSALPVWTSMDPLCEDYFGVSPYNFCGSNPINAIDLEGRDWYQNNSTSYYTWFDGDEERENFTHIGGKGSVLGEFEGIIDNILTDPSGPNLESMYSTGFTFDIAPNDKGALIGSKERGWDFFDEFVNGTGPEFSVLLGNHPYTQEMMTDDTVVKAQNMLRNGKTTVKGQITGFGRDWGPLDVLTHTSFVKQYIGSYRYDGYTSQNGKYINNVIYDSKSVTSLSYRVMGEHRRNSGKHLGNTYQFYIWQSKK